MPNFMVTQLPSTYLRFEGKGTLFYYEVFTDFGNQEEDVSCLTLIQLDRGAPSSGTVQ